MQGVIDKIFSIIGAFMSGYFLCSATYDNFVDISANLYLPVAISDRYRIIIGFVSHQ